MGEPLSLSLLSSLVSSFLLPDSLFFFSGFFHDIISNEVGPGGDAL